MRYFIAKDKSEMIVSKLVYEGDDSKIDEDTAGYLSENEGYTISEVDQASFDATAMAEVQTEDQKTWTAFKKTNPTVQQSIAFMAKSLGLE